MFYRIGKIKCKPGKSDDVISYFKSKRVSQKQKELLV